jgi:TolB-like protein
MRRQGRGRESVITAAFNLNLFGPFRLCGQDGRRINVSSKKSQALIAMLAVSGSGERTRTWLQSQLWGSRAAAQAQASLRSELLSLRALLASGEVQVLTSDKNVVRLELSLIKVDARDLDGGAIDRGQFLEGIDIPGEEGFEEWLREERARVAARAKSAVIAPPSSATPVLASIPTAEFEALPALAVLPFVNLSGAPELAYQAEGLSEDLIDRLSRLRWLPIIARSSSFGISQDEADPRAIGKRLGARYLLEGRLRDDAGVMTLAASLVDTETGQMVWSNKLRLDAASPAALEELLTSLSLTLGAKIDQQEQARAMRKPQSDLNVRDLIWRGRWHLNRFTKEDSAAAKACFAEALNQEPNSPEAIIQMTNAMLWDSWALRRSDYDVKQVRQMAQKAIIADFDDARGHMMAGIAESFLRQPIRAKAFLQRAIELNPSLFFAHSYLGSALYLNDEPEAALEQLNLAIRLSPNDQHLFQVLGEVGICHLMLGNYEQAIEFSDAAIMRRASYRFSHVVKINAFAHAGDRDGARQAYQDLVTANPKFDESQIDWVPFCNSKWNDFLKQGLNLAVG